MRTATNWLRVGDFNQAVILDQIRRSRDGISRAELTRRTGLSAQTVSNIAVRLLDAELIVESGVAHSSGRGRPATVLRLNATGRYAIGIHIDPVLVSFAMIGLDGKVVAQSALRTPETSDPDIMIAQLVSTVERMLAGSPFGRDRALGIGLAVPGPIDKDRGVILSPPLLEAWRDVPLRDVIEVETGLATVLDKDVNAAASGVLWDAERTVGDDFVFVYLGAGTAMTVVLGGEVVRGRTANAGEAGEWTVADGRNAITFGEAVGALGILRSAIAAGLVAPDTSLGSNQEVYDALLGLCRRAIAGDEVADALLAAKVRNIAQVAGPLARVLELPTVVVGGPTWDMWPSHHIDLLSEELGLLVRPQEAWHIRAASAPFGNLVAAVGGASRILEARFAPRPASLLL